MNINRVIIVRVLFFFFFSLIATSNSFGQSPFKELQNLENKGITEQQVNARLLEKGIDLDKVDPTNQEEVQKVETAIQEVVKELEGEIKQDLNQKGKEELEQKSEDIIDKIDNEFEEKIDNTIEEEAKVLARDATKDIQVAVAKGASSEEAIIEELTDIVNEDLEDSPIFGQHIFRNQSIQVYRQSNEIVPPDTYVLGSGDKLAISIWGASQADFAFTINDKGYIQPSQMTRINLAGLTLVEAQKKVRSRFNQYYQFLPEEFALTVTAARTITVNISGEVTNYGSFTMSAINTAFNALVGAGGPTEIGSVRDIKLIRGNKTKTIDVYDFLNAPETQFDWFLENNDIIYVPSIGKLVDIQGAIKRPFKYELTPGENLVALIEYAGGLAANAHKKNIQINRIDGDKRKIIDINLLELSSKNEDFLLEDGDYITIRNISNQYDNFVSIEGAVDFPGEYAFEEGMRLSQLIAKGSLTIFSKTDFAYLQRANTDQTKEYQRINLKEIIDNPGSESDIVIRSKDKLTILSLETFAEDGLVAIEGAVRNPGKFPYDQTGNMKIEDLVLISGGLKLNAAQFAYIQRIDTSNQERKEFIRIDIQEALKNPDSRNNIVLRPADIVTIYSNESFTDESSVSIEGNIRTPVELPYDGKLKVADMIYLAKGLQPDAADFGYIERTNLENRKIMEYIQVDLKKLLDKPESPENIVLKPFDKIKIFSKESFTEQVFVSIKGAVRNPKQFVYDGKLKISDVVYLAQGLTPEATDFGYIARTNPSNQKMKEFIRVDIKSALENPSSPENIVLSPLDELMIYNVQSFTDDFKVSIGGSIRNPGDYPFSNSLTIKDMITLSGGFKLEASKNRIEVFRVILEENKPTKTVVAELGVDSEFNIISGDSDFKFFPFDKVVVRAVPDFELQQYVTIGGEVNYPGTYALVSKNEQISDLIARAGGITEEAFPQGATLDRSYQATGKVILKLDKVLKNRSKKFNYILKPGDVISIPKARDLVSIKGVTNVHEYYPDRFLENKHINVAYHSGRRAHFYVKKFAGGINKEARGAKKAITVEHANGEIKKTRNFFFFSVSPKVRTGSKITVGRKAVERKEPDNNPEEKEKVDWGALSAKVVAQATSILTLIVLLQRIDN